MAARNGPSVPEERRSGLNRLFTSPDRAVSVASGPRGEVLQIDDAPFPSARARFPDTVRVTQNEGGSMLHNVEELEGYAVEATDGELGTVKDIYFDDEHWAIRYLVVETGGWLSGRKVLISPSAVHRVAWNNEVIEMRLTRQQVKDSPRTDTDKPVSRQHEMDFHDYYGYPYYWQGAWAPFMPIMCPIPSAESSADAAASASPARRDDVAHEVGAPADGKREAADSHLRSSNDVIGHEAMASDGPIGSVQTFVFDDETWAIRSLVVNTGNWLPGKRVLLSPQHIQRISWPEREVYLDITRQEVKASPEYTRHLKADCELRE
jgi:sporulation protein YlmC with PRC-barrel domain